MAGHSKWKGIKHKKAIVDAARGKVFSRVIRELTSAARLGGGSIDGNPRLRLAVQKAREANLPKDTLEKAIKRGTGELPGVSYEEMVIEGYGPGGVAVMVELLSDNKNRTSAEIRRVFVDSGGSVAGAGSVSWLFQKKGMITAPLGSVGEETLMEAVLEAGAEDLKVEGGQATIIAPPAAFEAVKLAVEKAGLTPESSELTAIPSNSVRVEDPAKAKALLSMLDELEEQEDSQHVWANFDIPDAILAEHAGA